MGNRSETARLPVSRKRLWTTHSLNPPRSITEPIQARLDREYSSLKLEAQFRFSFQTEPKKERMKQKPTDRQAKNGAMGKYRWDNVRIVSIPRRPLLSLSCISFSLFSSPWLFLHYYYYYYYSQHSAWIRTGTVASFLFGTGKEASRRSCFNNVLFQIGTHDRGFDHFNQPIVSV